MIIGFSDFAVDLFFRAFFVLFFVGPIV
jgi:hypothetical protein